MHYLPPLLSFLMYVVRAALRFMCIYPCEIQVDQVAKGVISTWDAVLELLESIEHFLNRLDIYMCIPRTPAMDQMVAKIMVELLSMLALATRDLKQGRSSESVLADVLPYSAHRSQMRKESIQAEGCRIGPAETEPTHAR
jgi:hypothetical protein